MSKTEPTELRKQCKIITSSIAEEFRRKNISSVVALVSLTELIIAFFLPEHTPAEFENYLESAREFFKNEYIHSKLREPFEDDDAINDSGGTRPEGE